MVMAALHATGGVVLGDVELVGSAELPQPESIAAKVHTRIRINIRNLPLLEDHSIGMYLAGEVPSVSRRIDGWDTPGIGTATQRR